MKIEPTYNAKIYCGLREGYSDTLAGAGEFFAEIRRFVERGLCVTVTPTDFVYKDGSEPGYILGLINYPRFPKTPKEIREEAVELALLLKKEFLQYRVSIVFTDKTIMLEDGDTLKSVVEAFDQAD